MDVANTPLVRSDEQEAQHRAVVHQKFLEARGFWDPIWDTVLEVDPDLLDAYIDLSSVPWKNGTLSPKVRELIYVAMNASTTHLYLVGIRVHIRNAIQHGATIEEATAVLGLVSELGSHSMLSVLPAMRDEMGRQDIALPSPDARAAAIKEHYASVHGEWDDELDAMLTLAPDYLEAFSRYMGVIRGRGVLDTSTVHLIGLAHASSGTHLDLPAVRFRLRQALKAGVEPRHIVEMLEIVSMVGVHTLLEGMPIIAEEFARAAATTEAS